MGRTLQLQTPRVYLPLLQPSRYKGAHGGRGSGKSHIFAELLVEKCLLQQTRAVCIREIQRSLEQSVKRLLEDKIAAMGVGSSFRIMNTHIETPHDGVLIFNGMQNHTAESIKSLEGYDIAWIEEAQSLSERSLTLLRPTIRKPDSEIWASWNPRHDTDPIDKLLRGPSKPPDAVVVESNWQDNPFFPDVLRREMEWDRAQDIEKYAHVWGGGYEKHSEARVFKNWRIEEFDTPPNIFFYLGGDWGYSIDPTVLVRCFEQSIDPVTNLPHMWTHPVTGVKLPRKRLYVDQEVYRIGCEIDHIPALFDTMDSGKMRQWPIVADSARPETISYLKRFGYPLIEPAIKGANSVKEGIIFLQGYDIVVHPRCVHTIDELTMYSYKRDPLTNIVTPLLEDKKNHVIDSLRYAVERLRGATVTVREALWG